MSAPSPARVVLVRVSLGELPATPGPLASARQGSRGFFALVSRSVGLESDPSPAGVGPGATCLPAHARPGGVVTAVRGRAATASLGSAHPHFWRLACVQSGACVWEPVGPGGDTGQCMGFPGSGFLRLPAAGQTSCHCRAGRGALSRTSPWQGSLVVLGRPGAPRGAHAVTGKAGAWACVGVRTVAIVAAVSSVVTDPATSDNVNDPWGCYAK